MLKLFDGRQDWRHEQEYLAWSVSHPNGFIVNTDRELRIPQYPMVHSAAGSCVTTPSRGNYTKGKYIKVCSESLEELQAWASRNRRELLRCARCMK